MRAAVLHAFDRLPACEQFPDPMAHEDELIVCVQAAALKPVDKQIANGSHYASPPALPVVCGIDGVGHLEDGSRVYFAGSRQPYGAMAQLAVVSRNRCFPLPADVDDVTAAALINPGVSAWLTLAFRAKLVRGETVLVLGGTGVTGKLAIQIAKILGAGRVVAAGRNEQVLSTLHKFGADAIIQIDKPGQDLSKSLAEQAGDTGYGVIVDYVWGRPTEALFDCMTRKEFANVNGEARLVQVGESAGSTVSLRAAVLRSSALTILGTAGVPSRDTLVEAFQQVMTRAAHGELRIEVEQVALEDVNSAWQRDSPGRRFVLIP